MQITFGPAVVLPLGDAGIKNGVAIATPFPAKQIA
jgi:hypothetical protein